MLEPLLFVKGMSEEDVLKRARELQKATMGQPADFSEIFSADDVPAMLQSGHRFLRAGLLQS